MTFFVITWILAIVLIILSIFVGIPQSPWLNSKKKQRDLLKKHLHLTSKDVFFDLGCGDASLLCELAKAYPDAKYRGVENFIIPFLLAKIRIGLFYKKFDIKIHFRNLYKEDLSNSTYVYCFLLPKMYPKLLKKIQAEIKNPVTIILSAWAFSHVPCTKIIKEDNLLPFFIYKFNQE